ncbi:MAG TPA: universal stress protein [Candidatus Baltobacteraceae bacterium]|nr:universal stress protein [Candidatus Baltobacteraceae bacterium]
MRILVVFDGSDDGLEGLRMVAPLLAQTGTKHEITLAIVAWPPRPSPIWDRAFEREVAADDLHRAMAEVGAIELERLRNVFSGSGSLETAYLEGDPTDEILSLIASSRAELLIVGLTRGQHAHSVSERVLAMVQRSSLPAILAFGAPP